MTGFLLFGILCALVVIARELRLLRRQHGKSSSPEQAPQYTARIFTFSRSRWGDRITQANVFVAGFIGLWIWAKFIQPELPADQWISTTWGRYLAAVIFGLVTVWVTESILNRFMEKYDQRVFDAQFSDDERELFSDMSWAERESIYREKGL